MDFLELLIDLLVFYGIFRALFGKKKKVKGKKRTQLPSKPREIPHEEEASPEYPETAMYQEDSEEVCLHDLEYDEPDEQASRTEMLPAEPQQEKPQVKVYGSLGEMLHDMQAAMTELSETVTEQTKKQTKQSRRRRMSSRRKAEPAVSMPDAACDYCTGEAEAECAFDSEQHADLHAGKASKPATPLVITDSEAVRVDMAAVQRNLKLSDVQQAVVWREILDKPLALRRNRR
jgi:hypothetical protein